MRYDDVLPQIEKDHIFSLAHSVWTRALWPWRERERENKEKDRRIVWKIHENFHINEGLKTNKLVKKMERKSQMQDTQGAVLASFCTVAPAVSENKSL
jgi:hypothetical protein